MTDARQRTRGLWIALAACLGLCAVYLVVELALAGRLGPSLDDGWIYMAFARGFLEGDPFSFPGHDGPVASVTGPIWCFLLAAAMFVLGAGPVAMKVLGVGSALFAVYGAFRLARAATGDVRIAGVAAVLVAVTPRVIWGALSGMEVTFAVGAVALGFALHLERRSDPTRRWLVAALVLTLAGWARPETFAFLPVVALHRRRIDGLLLSGVLIATYPAFHAIVYGYPLPMPFYAKAAGQSPLAILGREGVMPAIAATATNVGTQLASFVAWLPSFLPFLAPAVLLGVRRGLRERDGVPLLFVAIFAFGVARGVLGFQPPVFQQGRYFAYLWPLFLVVGLHGFDMRRASSRWVAVVLSLCALGAVLEPKIAVVSAFDWIPGVVDVGTRRAMIGFVWVPAAVFSGLAVAGLVVARRSGQDLLPRPPTWAVAAWLVVAIGFGALRHGEGVRDTYDLNVAMAERVAAEVPEGELVACHDLGALAWFARRPLLDLAGLGSPEVATGPRGADGLPDVATIVRERKPRYLCLTPSMMDRVNPGGRPVEGIRSFRVVATVQSERNVTVLGNTYHLIEIDWR